MPTPDTAPDCVPSAAPAPDDSRVTSAPDSVHDAVADCGQSPAHDAAPAYAPGVTLYHGDCLKFIHKIPDQSFDMILADPPYSSGGLYLKDRQKDTRTKYTDDDYNGASRFASFSGDNMDQRSFTIFLREVLFAGRYKLKPGAVAACFCDWRQLAPTIDAVQLAGYIYRGIVVWNKGISRAVPDRFRNDCEFIVWGTNGNRPAVMIKGCKVFPGCYTVPGVTSDKKHHQTEKPVALLEQLLQIVPRGGHVLDPFMGSGSTGVAAVKCGIHFTGIELDPGYFITAQNRIARARETAEFDLFNQIPESVSF